MGAEFLSGQVRPARRGELLAVPWKFFLRRLHSAPVSLDRDLAVYNWPIYRAYFEGK